MLLFVVIVVIVVVAIVVNFVPVSAEHHKLPLLLYCLLNAYNYVWNPSYKSAQDVQSLTNENRYFHLRLFSSPNPVVIQV